MSLSISGLTVHYGKAQAIKGISLEAEEGQIITIIGANGAGKTTLLKTISGMQKATAGEITYQGKRIDMMSPQKIVGLGIAHVPEGRRVFPFMSVRDNLLLGAFLRRDRSGIGGDLELVFRHFPPLKDRLGQQAGSLSGGEQQMLAIARALMANPTLLMLDEPSLGLAPKVVGKVGRIIREINGEGMSIILVEQNTTMALRVAHRGYVLEIGRVALSGDVKELMGNEDIKRAYLGI
jgi:branched-chain amino acid transport system ATP-binding protein